MLNVEIFNAIHEVLRFKKEDDELVELLGHRSCMRNGTPHLVLSPQYETGIIGDNVFVDIYKGVGENKVSGVLNTHMDMTDKQIAKVLFDVYIYIENYVKS